MFILGFSIPVLVLYFKYKKVQTSGKRTAIIILNILLSVFSFFSLIDLLITIIGGSLLNPDYIRQIYESSRGSSYNYSYVNPSDVITTTSSILATVMWALMIINFFYLGIRCYCKYPRIYGNCQQNMDCKCHCRCTK